MFSRINEQALKGSWILECQSVPLVILDHFCSWEIFVPRNGSISILGLSVCPPNGCVEDRNFLILVLSHSAGPVDGFKLLHELLALGDRQSVSETLVD